MNLDTLIAEGEALLRPSKVLSSGSGPGTHVGFWGGECEHSPNVVSPEAKMLTSRNHIITIESTFLGSLPIRECSAISVFEYRTASGGTQYRIEEVKDIAASEIRCSGEKLFALDEPSFPPFEAVCLYGSGRVERWLAEQQLERFQYSMLHEDELVLSYQDEFISRHPLYRGTCDAVLSGWHFTWPDDEFYRPLETRLAILTIRDAEPYLEVWANQSLNLEVIARIT